MNSTTSQKPARKSVLRTFKGSWQNVRAQFIGVCPLSGARLYEPVDGGSDDPRGPLGIHACFYYVASEYGMKGPDLVTSWIHTNDNVKEYNRGLALAKTQWTPAT